MSPRRALASSPFAGAVCVGMNCSRLVCVLWLGLKGASLSEHYSGKNGAQQVLWHTGVLGSMV